MKLDFKAKALIVAAIILCVMISCTSCSSAASSSDIIGTYVEESFGGRYFNLVFDESGYAWLFFGDTSYESVDPDYYKWSMVSSDIALSTEDGIVITLSITDNSTLYSSEENITLTKVSDECWGSEYFFRKVKRSDY